MVSLGAALGGLSTVISNFAHFELLLVLSLSALGTPEIACLLVEDFLALVLIVNVNPN